VGHSLALFFSISRTTLPTHNYGPSLIVELMGTCQLLRNLYSPDDTVSCVQELAPMISILCLTATARWWTSSFPEIAGKDSLLLIENLAIEKHAW
jgi:hypothetical protein